MPCPQHQGTHPVPAGAEVWQWKRLHEPQSEPCAGQPVSPWTWGCSCYCDRWTMCVCVCNTSCIMLITDISPKFQEGRMSSTSVNANQLKGSGAEWEFEPQIWLLGIHSKNSQRMERLESPEHLMGFEKSPHSSWTCFCAQEEQWEALADVHPEIMKTWRDHWPSAAWCMAYLSGEPGLWWLPAPPRVLWLLMIIIVFLMPAHALRQPTKCWGLCAKMRKVNSTPLITTIVLCAFDLQSALQTLAN